MGLSLIEYTYTGDTDYDINFALGYASEADVAAFVVADPPVEISFDFLTPSRVRIDDTNLVNGDTIQFTRTVSKTNLPVDLTQPSNLTREAITAALVHSLYAQHEVLDGRVSNAVEFTDLAFATAQSAVDFALENFLFETQTVTDVVMTPSLTASEIVTYTSGGTLLASAVDVYLKTLPSSDIEVLVSNNGSVVYSFFVNTAGVISGASTADITLLEGPITVEVTGGDYASGAELTIVMPLGKASIVDFDTQLDDYIAIFEAARNAP